MSTNNIYYIDMEQRFNEFKSNKINLHSIHHMVYEINNVALAIRQLSKSSGRYTVGPNNTNYKTLENYSISELAEIVKDRLINKKMDYVKRIYIPKENNKSNSKRPLGICSIWDKLVEKCIQLVLEPYCETKFVPSSFGFREQVSAHNALAKVKNQCQTMPYVLSVDLKNYFGTIDPNIAYREMWHIGIKDKIILNYIFRFIKKGYYESSCKVEDPKGAPQGSILGPLICNIYLHRFDIWLRDQSDSWHDKTVEKFHDRKNKRAYMRKTNLKIGIHVRYADDILVLCKNIDDAKKFKYSVTKYLTKNMKLIINTEKTKVYDLSTEKMKFLGFNFHVFKTKTRKNNFNLMVVNTLPENRANIIVKKCRELLNQIKNHPNITTIHNWNMYVIGIHNYYKGMNHFNECFSKIGWRIYKRFYHTMNIRAKFVKNESYKNNYLGGKYKSWGKSGYYCFNNYPIIQISWANWDSKLISAYKGTIKRKNPYDYGKKKHKPGVSIKDINYLVCSSWNIKNSTLGMFRVSKYSSVKGISYLSGEYIAVENYHCHHIIPRCKNGKNDFDNLCVLSEIEHKLLHSKNPEKLYDLYPKRKTRIRKLIKNL